MESRQSRPKSGRRLCHLCHLERAHCIRLPAPVLTGRPNPQRMWVQYIYCYLLAIHTSEEYNYPFHCAVIIAIRASLGSVMPWNSNLLSAILNSHSHNSASRSRALLKAFIDISINLIFCQGRVTSRRELRLVLVLEYRYR